ncbi:MAG: hypothetical protein H8F28_00265 [Fibrella sp.]|nr:hypothetical protein [Armatimonadota bacterium]
MSKPNIQILEQGKTLSQCALWSMIEEYYRTAGPDAWNETPYYPTSNAFIADSYAELIVAFLRDYLPLLDLSQPVYVLEMATGSGALSFLLLNALRDKLAQFPSLQPARLCYVMTDFAERNVVSWETDVGFQPFVEQGMLDFALFAPETQDSVVLRRSGEVLNSETVRNPIIAIANYFFDSIRQDFFQFENGVIREARLTLYRELGDGVDPASKPRLDEIKLQDRFVPVYSNYYRDVELNELLKQYQADLPTGSVLFPIGAFHSLRNLRRLSSEKLLLIASDKGFHSLEYMRGHSLTPYTPHPGSFAYMVNFHALGRYFENTSGKSWHAQEHFSLTTMVGISFVAEHMENLSYAARNLRQRNLIKNGYQLSPLLEHFESREGAPDAELLRIAVACVEFSAYDPWIFGRCGEYLCEGLNEKDYAGEALVRDVLCAVERNIHRRVVGAHEACGYLRRLYFILDDADRCLAINQKTIALFGTERDSFYYPAAIQEMRGPQIFIVCTKLALHVDRGRTRRAADGQGSAGCHDWFAV